MRPTGGVRRYAVELEKAIATFGQPKRIGEDFGLRVGHVAGRRIGGSLARLAIDARASAVAARGDIVHSIYYDCSMLGSRIPLIATFHDCIHERFSVTGGFRSSILARDKRKSVERARFVISVSQSTARDVAELYGLEPERSVVISPPVGDSFTDYHPSARTDSDRPRFLFVGRRDAYKNWSLLVQAFGLLCKKHPLARLTSIGGGPLLPLEMEQLRLRGLREDQHEIWSEVSDTELAGLYAESVAVVCPSSYEGFGYTVAEALCAGGNAIASSGGSLVEFGPLGCQLFENGDVDSLLAALEHAIEAGTLKGGSTTKSRASAIDAFGIDGFRVRIADLYDRAIRNS
jgi:glycosyltransferase involved in cell wall biosynthesis